MVHEAAQGADDAQPGLQPSDYGRLLPISKLRTNAISDNELPSSPRTVKGGAFAAHTLRVAVLLIFATLLLSP
jgi:hypothetical protein